MTTYLTPAEAGSRVQMSADWVRAQCKNRKLAATKVGQTWRIRPEDLDGFMAKYRGTGEPAPQPWAATSTVHRHIA